MRETTSALNVSLEHFEGPLALLLYLIRKEEMDINNIPVHRITQQYLEHMQLMKTLNLEVASDFITMAATLIYIKSKILLPQYDAENDDMPDDPRKELVQKLVEYQKYQSASKKLLERSILGRDTWRRGIKEDIFVEGEADIIVEDNGLFQLISAWRFVFKAAQKRIHRVMKKGQSIASRILEIKDLLIPGRRLIMRELLANDTEVTKNKLLVTFLSMLELGKMGFVRLFQSDVYADIHVETMRTVDGDVLSRVESYDGVNAEHAAQMILEKAKAQQSQSEEENAPLEAAPVVETDQKEFTFEAPTEENSVLAGESLDVASDDDILNAELELGLAEGLTPSEADAIPASMEPIEDLQKALYENLALKSLEEFEKQEEASSESEETVAFDEQELKKDFEPEL